MPKKIVTSLAIDGYSTVHREHGHIVSQRVQNTDPYYEFNANMRKEIRKEAVTRHWALPIANIPFADYKNLVKANPDLNSTDAEVKTKAWLAALKEYANAKLLTVDRNLVPDSLNPDRGSILPKREEPKDAG